MAVEEVEDRAVGDIELGAGEAVGGAFDFGELRSLGAGQFPKARGEAEALIERDYGIGGAVEGENGADARVREGQGREAGGGRLRGAWQQGVADERGCGESSEVGDAIEIDDGADGDRGCEGRHEGEVAAGGFAGYDDGMRVGAVRLRVGGKPSEGMDGIIDSGGDTGAVRGVGNQKTVGEIAAADAFAGIGTVATAPGTAGEDQDGGAETGGGTAWTQDVEAVGGIGTVWHIGNGFHPDRHGEGGKAAKVAGTNGTGAQYNAERAGGTHIGPGAEHAIPTKSQAGH